MIILSVNVGSSVLSFTGFKMPEKEAFVSGVFEKIGMEDSFYTIIVNDKQIKKDKYFPAHVDAVNTLLEELLNYNFITDYSDIKTSIVDSELCIHEYTSVNKLFCDYKTSNFKEERDIFIESIEIEKLIDDIKRDKDRILKVLKK